MLEANTKMKRAFHAMSENDVLIIDKENAPKKRRAGTAMQILDWSERCITSKYALFRWNKRKRISLSITKLLTKGISKGHDLLPLIWR